jgi:F-type H+-transporting ATPase subunit b
MSIDWFTFAAQLLNFVALIWLLKRFLYKPVLDAVAAREQRIAAQLADAEATKAEAHQQRETFLRKNAEFEAQQAEMLEQATAEAKAEYQRLAEEARQSVDAMRANRIESLRQSTASLHQAIARRTQQEVFAVSRKLLSEIASADLEAQIVTKLIERLYAIGEKKRKHLRAAFESAQDPLLIRSAFELPEDQRAAIQAALKEVLGADYQFRFESVPALVSGIEIIANGQKVAWSLSNYLGSLEQDIEALVRPTGEDQQHANSDDASTQPRHDH